jgi:hypothetical protein
MNTDDMLVEQAARNKAQNPTAKVFVYRNIVKVVDMQILQSPCIVTIYPVKIIYPCLIVTFVAVRLVPHRRCHGTPRSENCCRTKRTGVCLSHSVSV